MTAPEDTVEGLKCDQHGTPTLLTCAQCGTPLCPRCAVWTEVGQKCANCSGRRPAGRSTRSRAVPVVMGVLGVLVLGGGALYLASDAFQGSGSTKVSADQPGGTPLGTVGEEVTQRGVTYLVSKFECGAKEIGTAPVRTTAAGQYCFLHLNVRNDGANPVFLAGTQQVLLDDAKRRYNIDPGATIANASAGQRQSALGSQLNPGVEVSSVFVYDVPPDVAPAEAELHVRQAGGGGGIVRVPEREVRVRLSPAA